MRIVFSPSFCDFTSIYFTVYWRAAHSIGNFRKGSKVYVIFNFEISDEKSLTKVNRTLRLANKKLVSERSVRFYYFFYGCILFVFLPSLLFTQAENNWSYLDAVYFSVISLTKIGFGDFVPSTTPPDVYADSLLNATRCLNNLTSPNPARQNGVRMPEGSILILLIF